jgi:hypothetical protein
MKKPTKNQQNQQENLQKQVLNEVFGKLGIPQEQVERAIAEEKKESEEERARFIRDLGYEIAKRLKETTPIVKYIG